MNLYNIEFKNHLTNKKLEKYISANSFESAEKKFLLFISAKYQDKYIGWVVSGIELVAEECDFIS